MGIRTGDCGISIQFCHADGDPDGAPIHGRYAMIYGGPRPDLITATQDEKKFSGSDDWLTLIAVADTKERLEDILHQTDVSATPPHTSHSSRRACIEVHIGGIRQTFRDRITIASGPIVSLLPKDIRIDAVHVKILPQGAELCKMDEESRFLKEFVGGAQALLTQ